MSEYTKEITAYMAQQATIKSMSAEQRRAYDRALTRRAWKLHAEAERERLKDAPQVSVFDVIKNVAGNAALLLLAVWLLSQAGIMPFGG